MDIKIQKWDYDSDGQTLTIHATVDGKGYEVSKQLYDNGNGYCRDYDDCEDGAGGIECWIGREGEKPKDVDCLDDEDPLVEIFHAVVEEFFDENGEWIKYDDLEELDDKYFAATTLYGPNVCYSRRLWNFYEFDTKKERDEFIDKFDDEHSQNVDTESRCLSKDEIISIAERNKCSVDNLLKDEEAEDFDAFPPRTIDDILEDSEEA